MKICPKCGKTYPSAGAAFCFNDGFPLADHSPEPDAQAPDAPPDQGAQGDDKSALAQDSGEQARSAVVASPVPLGEQDEASAELPRPGLEPVPLRSLLSSTPTFVPLDIDDELGLSIPLAGHLLGDPLQMDAESLIFRLEDGRAAWIHRPDLQGSERFVKRAQGVVGVHSEGLLQIHEVGEHKGLVFAVVEAPDGYDLCGLTRRLRAKGVSRMEPACVLDLGCALSAAMMALHQAQPKGLLGELHPRRVWVSHEGQVRLLSSAGQSPQLPPEEELDRWSLLAPELSMRPERADGRADIYSLGAMLWSLLTGRNHALKSDLTRTILATKAGPPQDLSSPLHELLARCMAAEPGDRVQSAKELKGALEALRGEQRGAWGPLVMQAFPGPGPFRPMKGAYLDMVEHIRGVCVGTIPVMAAQSRALLELPQWPLAAPPTATLAVAAPLLEKQEPPVTAVPEESTSDEDSLASAFFTEPEPAEELDDLPPPVRQRSWGLAIGGALLGVSLLAGGGYLSWKAMGGSSGQSVAEGQDERGSDQGSAGEQAQVDQAAEDAAAESAAAEKAAAEEAEKIAAEKAAADQAAEKAAAEQAAAEKAAAEKAAAEEAARGRRGGRRGNRRGNRTPPSQVQPPAGGGDAPKQPRGDGGAAKTDGGAGDPVWESSPWGEASGEQAPKDPPPDGNPWGEVK